VRAAAGGPRRRDQLASALARPGALVLVEGEAGIGKSRLIREFLASADGRGRTALVAACPPVHQPFTLGPLVDALRQAAGRAQGLQLSPLAGTLRPLLPEWAAGLPAAPEPLPDASAARHQLFRALAELLGGLGVSVLVVEDAHWADEVTLEFLLFMMAGQPQRISLVVTFRPEEIAAVPLLRRLSSRLPAVGGTRITLCPLDVRATASLVSSMLGSERVSEDFAVFLHERTDGLPLAVEESVRLLYDRSDLIRHAGQWERRSLRELAVPPTVRDSVLERVQRLTPAARGIVQAAAVLTDPASEQGLITVAGLAAGQAEAGLTAALGSGILAEDERGLVCFRHALACRAVYQEIPFSVRRRLHHRAARALRGVVPSPVAQLARHYREAGEAREWRRYAEQAADLALAVGDESAAAGLLHDLITGAGLPPEVVLRLAGKVPLYGLSRHSCLGDLADRVRAAIDSGCLTRAKCGEAHSLLGRILLNAKEYLPGVAELEQAIPDLGERPAEAARAMVRLGWPGRTMWPAEVHRAWLNQAAATVATAGIPVPDRLELTVNRATALLQLGDPGGWALAEEIPEEAGAQQEMQHIVRGCMNVGSSAVQWGRHDLARRKLTAGLALAGQHDYPPLRFGMLVTLVHLDWFTGRWEGLAERAAALMSIDEADPLGVLEARLVDGLLDLASGQPSAEEKLQHVLDGLRRRGGVDDPLEAVAALAWLRLADGRTDDALAVTEQPMQVVTTKGIWLWAADVAPARVQALAAAGRCGEASDLVSAFAQGLHGGDVPAAAAALITCRAIVADGQGDTAHAADLFDDAATAWDTLPCPYEALRARHRQAGCLLAAGQNEAGLKLLTEAAQGLSDLGAAADAARARQTLREHGVLAERPRRAGRPGYGDQISPREAEVLRLLVTGRTNREIAGVLTVSPRTVASHIDSAMRKLKVSTRTALAVAAVEAGLAPGNLAPAPCFGSRRGLDPVAVADVQGGLEAGFGADGFGEAQDVALDGAFAAVQAAGDGLVGQAGGEQAEDGAGGVVAQHRGLPVIVRLAV
jgi:DNA-binding CsgD family transcriptional regulator